MAPFGYAVYSYIAGGNLLLVDLSLEQRQAVVADLAAFLRTLHDLQTPAALRQVLYVEDHLSLADRARRLLQAAETEIAPALSSRERHTLRHEFAQQIARYGQRFTPCLLHRDFCTDNIRMVNGAVAGVIDFGNIVLGDSEIEFAELYLEQGETVLREIAQRYGHQNPNALVEKMWRVSIVNQVEVIIDDAADAPAGVVEETWLTLRRLLQEA
ncbi:MAG: aminoglycoside phosphotransferase family protein [Caldilineaceae bacterium]